MMHAMAHAMMHAMVHAMMYGATARSRCQPSASRRERVAVRFEVRGLAASQVLLEGFVDLARQIRQRA